MKVRILPDTRTEKYTLSSHLGKMHLALSLQKPGWKADCRLFEQITLVGRRGKLQHVRWITLQISEFADSVGVSRAFKYCSF